jgi:hypothetical protein
MAPQVLGACRSIFIGCARSVVAESALAIFISRSSSGARQERMIAPLPLIVAYAGVCCVSLTIAFPFTYPRCFVLPK